MIANIPPDGALEHSSLSGVLRSRTSFFQHGLAAGPSCTLHNTPPDMSACAMNFLPSFPPFLALGNVPAKTGVSPLLLLLLLDIITTAWTCPQLSLLISAITWGIIWVVCAQAPPDLHPRITTRNRAGHEAGVWLGSIMFAGCLLLVGVCERASGVQSHWVKVRVSSYLRSPQLINIGVRQVFQLLSTSFARLGEARTRPSGARGGSCSSLQLQQQWHCSRAS